MIKTPVPIFGFPSIEEFKVYLDKNFYNEQPVTLLKSDLSELLDMVKKKKKVLRYVPMLRRLTTKPMILPRKSAS